MQVNETTGVLTVNGQITIDLRDYCESCYNHGPEIVNKGMIEQIRHFDNELAKNDKTYQHITKQELIQVGAFLSSVWESNKDKMNLIMDKSIEVIGELK